MIITYYCTKGLIVYFKSITKDYYKCAEHFNYLLRYLQVIQTNLQASKLFETHMQY
jgi:hypothetical protein